MTVRGYRGSREGADGFPAAAPPVPGMVVDAEAEPCPAGAASFIEAGPAPPASIAKTGSRQVTDKQLAAKNYRRNPQRTFTARGRLTTKSGFEVMGFSPTLVGAILLRCSLPYSTVVPDYDNEPKGKFYFFRQIQNLRHYGPNGSQYSSI